MTVEEVERAMRNHCSQCGQPYTFYPCGLGHATMRHMRKVVLEGVGLSEEIQKGPFDPALMDLTEAE